MSDIRLLAVDLDGTLLDPSGALTVRTRRAAEAAAERGVRLVLATARRFTGAVPVAEELRAVDALVVYDGAQVRGYPDGEIFFEQALPAMVGQRAAEVMAAHHLQPIAQHATYEGEHLLVAPATARGDWASAYLTATGQQVRRVPLERVCAGQPDALRVVAFGPLQKLRLVARELAGALPVGEAIRGDPPDEGPVSRYATQLLPMGNYGAAELTVFAPGISKGSALARLARRYGIALEQTMAIGDGINDVPLLRTAGLAVAMGHAPRMVRGVADVITTSNAEDGAARAIERYILDGERVVTQNARRIAAQMQGDQTHAAAE